MRRPLYYSILVICLTVYFSTNCFAYDKELRGLSDTLAGKIAKNSKKSVAVVDFTDLQGNVTELGRFIAEEISVNLTMAEKDFQVIDRNHLKTLLTEHKLSLSGLVDPETIKKIGQISGVDALVTGSVTPFGDNIRVTCKVIATDSAKIITADKTELAKTKAIDELLSRGIQIASPNPPTNNPKKQSTPQIPASPDIKGKLPDPVEIDNFVFLLKEAKMSTGEVTIVLEATNKSKKRWLDLGSGPQGNIMTDDFGNTYGGMGGSRLSESCDGNSKSTSLKKKKTTKKKSSDCSGSVETYGVVTKTVVFENVSSHIGKIQSYKTDVTIYDGKNNAHNLNFYNIPLTRSE